MKLPHPPLLHRRCEGKDDPWDECVSLISSRITLAKPPGTPHGYVAISSHENLRSTPDWREALRPFPWVHRWQVGQKWVPRWPRTTLRIGVPQDRQGLPWR
jgi:hypothetical protein